MILFEFAFAWFPERTALMRVTEFSNEQKRTIR